MAPTLSCSPPSTKFDIAGTPRSSSHVSNGAFQMRSITVDFGGFGTHQTPVTFVHAITSISDSTPPLPSRWCSSASRATTRPDSIVSSPCLTQPTASR
jgi:hypothetical protein